MALQHIEEVFPDMYSWNVLEINSKYSRYKYNLITYTLDLKPLNHAKFKSIKSCSYVIYIIKVFLIDTTLKSLSI